MRKVTYHIPSEDDILRVAEGLRESDVRELKATYVGSVADGLRSAVRSSAWCAYAEQNGDPLFLCGVVPLVTMINNERHGCPWWLSHDNMRLRSRLYVSEGRRVMKLLFQDYDRLDNYETAENTRSQRWLRRMGFNVEEPEFLPHYNGWFCHFWR